MEQVEETLAALLKEKKMSVTVAESCTGGMIAARLVNVPGISEYFWGSFVTYANEAKTVLLGVDEQLLEEKGAVSPEVAEAMALGAAKAAGADVGISSTGIAGPDGGTPEKPVGLVYIGCSIKGVVSVVECHFHGNRQEIRAQAAREALELAVACLNEYTGRK